MANYQRNTNLPINPASNAILGVTFPKGNPLANNGYAFAISSGTARSDTIKHAIIGGNKKISDDVDHIRSYAKKDRTVSGPSGYSNAGTPTYGDGRTARAADWTVDDNLSKIEVSYGNGQKPISHQIITNIVQGYPPNTGVTITDAIFIGSTYDLIVSFSDSLVSSTVTASGISALHGLGTGTSSGVYVSAGNLIAQFDAAWDFGIDVLVTIDGSASDFTFTNGGTLEEFTNYATNYAP
jgi:hypothetical protein